MLIINLKTEHRRGNYSLISERLLAEINTALQSKQQMILLHNRKGYARRVICSDCQYRWECPECGLPMIIMEHGTLHYGGPAWNIEQNRKKDLLLCPYCQIKNNLTNCPQCQGLKWNLLGYGLEKIKQELIKQTNSKIEILDSNQLAITNFDILLSTQLPLIDQADFQAPPLALAAILNADTDLYLPDFTASLRTFNRLIAFKKFCREHNIKQQIAQTYAIKNKIIQAAVRGEFDQFVKIELAQRRALNYPPYTRLIKLIYQNTDKKKCQAEAKKLYDQLTAKLSHKNNWQLMVTPPQPTFIPKVRRNYRYQIVIKIIKQRTPNLEHLNKMLKKLPSPWLIDVDPISLL